VTQQQDNSSELSVDFLGVVNDMQTARGIVHTPISPDHVYDLLSNYDQCPRVFRSVGSSQTLQNEAGGKQVLQVSSSWAATAAACRNADSCCAGRQQQSTSPDLASCMHTHVSSEND
jgi:hypothetical protein